MQSLVVDRRRPSQNCPTAALPSAVLRPHHILPHHTSPTHAGTTGVCIGGNVVHANKLVEDGVAKAEDFRHALPPPSPLCAASDVCVSTTRHHCVVVASAG